MTKRVLSFLLLASSLIIAQVAFALDRSFTVSASVPSATGISISASRITAATGTFTPIAGTALSFDPMIFNATNGIFLPQHFYAIDVAATGGAGSPDVTVRYTEGANPNSPGKGLGWKSTATFVKVTGATGSQSEAGLAAHGPKKLLKDLLGEFINETELTGGFLRIYVGIFTGDPNATFPEPATGGPFTAADAAGTYSGTLLVSATVD